MSPFMFRLFPALQICAFVVSALVVPAPATADFMVCNKTKSRVGIAVGHQKDENWITEGWWNLTPGDCDAILPGDLDGRYYYIFARDWDKGGDWGGATPMCTQTKVFTIEGVEDCASRGFDTSGFYEIDTGEEKTWTVQLTEPEDQ